MRWSFAFFFLMVLGSSVAAQSVTVAPTHPFQEIWDAIHALEARLELLKNKVDALIIEFTDYKTGTDNTILGLHATDENLQEQINIVDAKPFVIDRSKLYEVVNNDLNNHDAFCADNNDILLFGYCAYGFLGDPPNQELLLFDGFADFDLSNNPTWTVLYGNLFVGNPSTGTSAGDMVCASTSACEGSVPVSFTSMGVIMQSMIYSQQTGDELTFGLTDKSGPLTQSFDKGYIVRMLFNGDSSTIDLYRLDGSTAVSINHIGPMSLSSGSEYVVRAERNQNEFWQLYVNGGPVGAPVQDQTYLGFSFFHTKFDGAGSFDGGRFDNITVMSTDTPLNQSAFLNISNPNSPLGIRCQNNGAARIMCLKQE